MFRGRAYNPQLCKRETRFRSDVSLLKVVWLTRFLD